MLFLVVCFLLVVLYFIIRSKFSAAIGRITGLEDLHKIGKEVPTSKRLGRRAVVVGASWAGCLTAKVLLDHFEEVVVIENEDLGTQVITASDVVRAARGEEGTKPRTNIAQQWYGHGLLPLGLKAARAIFGEDIVKLYVKHGGYIADMGEIDFYHFGVELLCAPSGDDSIMASRFLLESGVRHLLFEKVKHDGRLIFRPNHQVRGLLFEEVTGSSSNDRKKVRGVQVKNNKDHESPLEEIEADLVVDSTGRAQAGCKWLEKVGIEVPKESLDSKVGYASSLFSNEGEKVDFKIALFAFGDHRDYSRLALFQNLEGGITQATLMGAAGNAPASVDPEGVRHFLAGTSIADRMTKNYEKLGEPLSVWKTYKPGPAQMVKYHQCPNLPEGIVAVGDAFACFNPTYGQGLTTSGLAVVTLDRIIREFEEKGTKSIDGVSTAYHALVAERLQVPWILPKAGDYSYPTTVTAEGETGDEMLYKLFQSYMCRVTQLTKVFPFIRLQWYKTIGMTDFGGKLFMPHIVALVLAHALGFFRVPTQPKPNEKTHPYVNPKLPLRKNKTA